MDEWNDVSTEWNSLKIIEDYSLTGTYTRSLFLKMIKEAMKVSGSNNSYANLSNLPDDEQTVKYKSIKTLLKMQVIYYYSNKLNYYIRSKLKSLRDLSKKFKLIPRR